MRYIKVRFTEGVAGLAYQEIDSTGNLVRYVSEKGETLVLPEVTASEVVGGDGPEHDWMSAPETIPPATPEEQKEFVDPVAAHVME